MFQLDMAWAPRGRKFCWRVTSAVLVQKNTPCCKKTLRIVQNRAKLALSWREKTAPGGDLLDLVAGQLHTKIFQD